MMIDFLKRLRWNGYYRKPDYYGWTGAHMNCKKRSENCKHRFGCYDPKRHGSAFRPWFKKKR